MEEVSHHISVLKNAKKAVIARDALALSELSNQTIHCAACFQYPGSTAAAVLIYALSKIIERHDYEKVKNWNKVEKRLLSFLELAAKALEDNNEVAFDKYLQQARTALTSASINLKPYIEEVMRKASINKAGKLYEHGLSLGKTAELLGVTQWELSSYAGQGKNQSGKFNETFNVRKRAQLALEFLS